MSKTACIVPWSTLAIGPDGRATFCCDVVAPLTVNGRQGSIYEHSLDALWNASELVQVRSAMARGEKPETCNLCWQREAKGGVSRRLLANTGYRQLGGQLAIEKVPLEGADSGYVLNRRPDWFILELGNVCDLKCRSCSPLSSSRIAADPVQGAWSGNPSARALRLAPENSPAWFKDVDAMIDMIASGGDGNLTLSLMGGEPFLIDSVWKLLDALVARGVAPRIQVGLSTNGQHRHARIEQLAPSFRGFSLSVSIDGYGKLYEYLRHGASWSRLADNLRWFRELPNTGLSIVPTLQNYNVLNIVSLLRFLEKRELHIAYNVLTYPARLHPANLPPSVRRIAAGRLRRYLDTECRYNAAVVRGYCEILDEAGEMFDAETFREFMTYTNDLDASRRESLAEAEPELAALIRAAGVEWSHQRRYTPSTRPERTIRTDEALQRVNRTVSPRDATFAGFEANGPGTFFSTAMNQLAEVDSLLLEHGHSGLAGCETVADFACHYGRFTRALRASLPHAAVYACDIDRDALRFCAEQLGAQPVHTGWRPDEDKLPQGLDAVFCVSLLTHTPLDHWRRTLRAWARMLQPGGIAAFTYLSERHIDAWLNGAMEHYGSYSAESRAAAVRSLRAEGHGFVALNSAYGSESLFGVAFATADVVRREIEAAGFEQMALPQNTSIAFGQDLALVRKPGAQNSEKLKEAEVQRDVSVVALYDPRCYAPPENEESGFADHIWSRLTAMQPRRPLPTELGFGDPRVPEIREAQAGLAGDHGIDAFCYLYPWGPSGPRWDAPWRDLVETGRPDFPFCLMIAVEGETVLSPEEAARLLDGIAAGLRDPRYLRVEGGSLLVVRDIARLVQPRVIAAAWRAAAAAHGIGELHLCAMEPAPADCPEDLGFDSFLEAPVHSGDPAAVISVALTRPWPRHRFFRGVECKRDSSEPNSIEWYEHWLRSAVDATRLRGGGPVFVHAWNDWLRSTYLEPDDRDGRAALLATRRAARGPGSGLVLLRQLRDELGNVGDRAAAVLTELGQVLALHEHTRDRLLATVEAALSRDQTFEPDALRTVPVASRHLPPSAGRFSIDRVGQVGGPEIYALCEPIPLSRDEVHIAGWAHSGAVETVDLFIALESESGTEDRIVRVIERLVRPDVQAAFPGYPPNCGFDAKVSLFGLPSGIYRIAVVQRTPQGAYRDATPVAIRLER